jgi:hypothetical protein
MARNLKALGLALVVVFAMTAVSASAASAAEFHSASENTKFVGTQVGINAFFTEVGAVECEITEYKGEVNGATTTSEVETVPTYEKCTAFGQPADITPHGTITITSNGTIHVNAPVTITVTSGGLSVCTLTVKAQGPRGTVGFDNQGSGSTADILLTALVVGLEYEVSGGNGNCGTEGPHSDGEYEGNVTVKGFGPGGAQVGIRWG